MALSTFKGIGIDGKIQAIKNPKPEEKLTEWEKKVLEAARNYILYDEIWGDGKVEEKIKYWKKDTAGHTCYEDPIQSKCMRTLCYSRPFGVKSDSITMFPRPKND